MGNKYSELEFDILNQNLQFYYFQGLFLGQIGECLTHGSKDNIRKPKFPEIYRVQIYMFNIIKGALAAKCMFTHLTKILIFYL